MPDKNDPRYRAKYERRYNAGRRFAEKSGICYLARQIQLLANKHRMLFIIIVFGFVLSCFFFNAYRFARSYRARTGKAVATERVETAIKDKKASTYKVEGMEADR